MGPIHTLKKKHVQFQMRLPYLVREVACEDRLKMLGLVPKLDFPTPIVTVCDGRYE